MSSTKYGLWYLEWQSRSFRKSQVISAMVPCATSSIPDVDASAGVYISCTVAFVPEEVPHAQLWFPIVVLECGDADSGRHACTSLRVTSEGERGCACFMNRVAAVATIWMTRLHSEGSWTGMHVKGVRHACRLQHTADLGFEAGSCPTIQSTSYQSLVREDDQLEPCLLELLQTLCRDVTASQVEDCSAAPVHDMKRYEYAVDAL